MASHHPWNKIQSPHHGRWVLHHLAPTFLSGLISSPFSSNLILLQAVGLVSSDKLSPTSKPCHVSFPLLQMLFPDSWSQLGAVSLCCSPPLTPPADRWHPAPPQQREVLRRLAGGNSLANLKGNLKCELCSCPITGYQRTF